MDKGEKVESDTKSARGRADNRSSVVAGPEEAGSGGGHVKCAAELSNCTLFVVAARAAQSIAVMVPGFGLLLKCGGQRQPQ